MSSILSSQSMVLATAMAAISGTVILLALRLQKSNSPTITSHYPLLRQQIPPSCIVSSGDGKKTEKKRKKKKVHFAEDVVDPIGNSEDYRKLHTRTFNHNNKPPMMNNSSNSLKKLGGKVVEEEKMPANRVALYNGIMRDRVYQRVAYSY